MSAGAIGQFFASPTDLVKVQMQMEGKRKLEGKPLRLVPLEAGVFFLLMITLWPRVLFCFLPSPLPNCWEPFQGKSRAWEARDGSGQRRGWGIRDFLLIPVIHTFLMSWSQRPQTLTHPTCAAMPALCQGEGGMIAGNKDGGSGSCRMHRRREGWAARRQQGSRPSCRYQTLHPKLLPSFDVSYI